MPYTSSFTAFYDANVLFSAFMRDMLMWQATTGLFRAKWSQRVLDEYTRNLQKKKPAITTAQLQHICDLMNANVLDALVEDYEQLIPSIIGLPDPDDRHVVAAAIIGRADVIVTYNLKDFPPHVLAPYGVEAQHPDAFLHHLIDLNGYAVCAAIKKQRANLKNPPKTVDEFLETLLRQGMPMTFSALQERSALL